MKVDRTTFECNGIQEPCIMVIDEAGYAQVRISKCYHYVGPDGLYVMEILGEKFKSEKEQMGDFDGLTDEDAIHIAKEYSEYL